MIKDTATYGTWLNTWINVFKKPYIKSWKTIKLNIRLHVPESLKKTKLKDLNVIDVQTSLNSVSSSRTRLDVYDIYHGSLLMAYRLELIQKDISQLLIKPKHSREVGQPLTNIELTKFLYSIRNHRLRNFYYFCLLTGCRRSEALNVLWSDIDLDNNLIHIRGTKTDLSDRYIPIFDELKELLSSMRKTTNRLFNYSPSFVSHKFKEFCPTHKLHDLRHTFATRCLECDISIKVVQSWLGHSRLDTTAMIYSHVLPDFQKSEAKKFNLF